jgi:hypothetical protein
MAETGTLYWWKLMLCDTVKLSVTRKDYQFVDIEMKKSNVI